MPAAFVENETAAAQIFARWPCSTHLVGVSSPTTVSSFQGVQKCQGFLRTLIQLINTPPGENERETNLRHWNGARTLELDAVDRNCNIKEVLASAAIRLEHNTVALTLPRRRTCH